VAVFVRTNGLEPLSGQLDEPLQGLLQAHLGEVVAAKEDPAAWELVRQNGVWC
jgi:hypothetical protein